MNGVSFTSITNMDKLEVAQRFGRYGGSEPGAKAVPQIFHTDQVVGTSQDWHTNMAQFMQFALDFCAVRNSD